VKRTLFGLLAGGLLLVLAGCGPSKDPLDWKIDASDPTALQEWFDTKVAQLPDPISREFRACISNIQLTLPPARTTAPLEKANYLCARLNGKTVRDVLIEGNELSYKMMLARSKTQSDTLLRLISAGEGLTDYQRSELPDRIAYARAELDQSRQLIARGEKRLEELRQGPAR
jgi:hypothetical protein